MLWSQTFIPTLKETPADAEIPSHKLMLRAGLIRKLSSGVFTFLPLGLRSLRRVEQIVRGRGTHFADRCLARTKASWYGL